MDPTDTDPQHCFFVCLLRCCASQMPANICFYILFGRIRSNMEQTGARPRHPAIALSAIPQPGAQECGTSLSFVSKSG